MADPNDLTREELIERNEELRARCDHLVRILRHLLPERSETFFICGRGGTIDEHGLPEAIEVCPQYGVGWSVLYRREEPRSERIAFEVVDAGSLQFDAPSQTPRDGPSTTPKDGGHD